MALKKAIRQDDGVITDYHRILFIQQTINRQNSIVVLSYVDSDAREIEQNAEGVTPYRRSVTYETDYDPTISVEKAYEYLKALPVFEGAENI